MSLRMCMSAHTARKQRGFTMIELSLVLFIVLIALTLTVTQFAQANAESERLTTVTYLKRAQNSVRVHFVGRPYSGLTGLDHAILMPEELRPGTANVFSLPRELSLIAEAVDDDSFSFGVSGEAINDASTCVSVALGMSRAVYAMQIGSTILMSSEQAPASVAAITTACQNLNDRPRIVLLSR